MTSQKIGILGVPYDTSASLGWPGARYAPPHVRRSLQWIFNRVKEQTVYDVEGRRLVSLQDAEVRDFGDLQLPAYDHEASLRAIEEGIAGVLGDGYFPLVIGGDHSITLGGFRALHSATCGNIGIIQVDAHLDLVKESETQGLYSGSSQMRRAIEMGRFPPQNIVQVGVRGFNYPEHYHFIRETGIVQITAPEVAAIGGAEAARRALAAASAGTEAIYLTVDIDSLDVAFAPGAGAEEPGGLTSRELLDFIRVAAPHAAVMDLVEVNPMTDHRNLTGSIAARILFDSIVSRIGA